MKHYFKDVPSNKCSIPVMDIQYSKMNKVLISYTPIGPTYKDRVIDNIKKYDAYQYFDVLILTDDPQYPGFDAIRHLPNIHIDDLTVHRDKYPEFYEYEKNSNRKKVRILL